MKQDVINANASWLLKYERNQQHKNLYNVDLLCKVFSEKKNEPHVFEMLVEILKLNYESWKAFVYTRTQLKNEFIVCTSINFMYVWASPENNHVLKALSN